jgi:hypothetical protein
MILRVFWKVIGEKVRMRVFSGRGDETNHDQLIYTGELHMPAPQFIELTQMHFNPEWIMDDDDDD